MFPDPDAGPKPKKKRAREPSIEVIEVLSPIGKKNMESESSADSDDVSFKRKPRQENETRKQITEITRIVTAQTSTGCFIQRDDAIVVTPIPVSNAPFSPLPVPPPTSSSFILSSTQFSAPITPSNMQAHVPQSTLISYPIPFPVSTPSQPLPFQPVAPPLPPSPPPPPPPAGDSSPPRLSAECRDVRGPSRKRSSADGATLHAYSRLRHADERNYLEFLREFVAPTEEITARRFFNILQEFRGN